MTSTKQILARRWHINITLNVYRNARRRLGYWTRVKHAQAIAENLRLCNLCRNELLTLMIQQRVDLINHSTRRKQS